MDLMTTVLVTLYAAEAPAKTVLQFDQLQLISMGIGTILPILVGLVTTRVTHPGIQASLLALFSAVAGFGTEYLGDPESFIWTAALLNWLNTFIIAVAMHYGLWKPTTVAAKAQSIPIIMKAHPSAPYDDYLVGDRVVPEHDLDHRYFRETP